MYERNRFNSINTRTLYDDELVHHVDFDYMARFATDDEDRVIVVVLEPTLRKIDHMDVGVSVELWNLRALVHHAPSKVTAEVTAITNVRDGDTAGSVRSQYMAMILEHFDRFTRDTND